MMEHYDMLVIGSGPSGRRAAIQSAKLGKSVLVVDKGRRLGGVSVHTGTIPSKTLRETVLNLSGWRERGFYGRGYRVKQDISIERPDPAAAQDARPRGRGAAAPVHAQRACAACAATAKFKDANTVSLTTENGDHQRGRLRPCADLGRHAGRTGPHNVPFDDKRIFDSDEMLELDRLPRTLTVIGGGVIGVEYATIFSALDVPVTLIEQRDTILDFVDREIVDDFIHQMRDRGMTIRLGSAVKEIARQRPNRVEVTLADGRVIRSEIVLYAAGRTGNVGSLGLDAVGIEADSRGRIKVDPADLPDDGAEHLCDRRRHRLSEPRLDVDGAGPRRRLPRLRRARCRRRPRPFPTASTPCRKSRRSASRRSRCARAASPTRSAWRASARPRAATSWASIPAS